MPEVRQYPNCHYSEAEGHSSDTAQVSGVWLSLLEETRDKEVLMRAIKWLYANWFSYRTISFWSALVGIATWSRKKLSVVLLFLVGFGGMGVAYGRFCDKNGLPIEPVALVKAYRQPWIQDRDVHAKEFWSHALFAAIGLIRLRRLR